ncbi:terminase large subunit [Vibrio phage K449]
MDTTEFLESENVFKLNPIAQGFLDRLILSLDTEAAYGNMTRWIEKNTMLEGRMFSFRDHEFQEAIVNDTSRRVVVRKCSQVGLSECSARLAIGVTATAKDSHFIYVMPTKGFAGDFSTSRIQPIINNSEVVKAMTDAAASKSKHLKMIGSSFLHIGGTAGSTSGAISVPAKRLFFDEYDFCEMRVAGQYESRLKHAPECSNTNVKGWITWFSTPTLPYYGVDEKFQNSDQKHYNVICDCGTTFAPDYERDLKIPGTPKNWKIKELTPEDINLERFRFKEAYIACPECGKDVWDELCDPKKRVWVAKYPGRKISGWQVHPWDCPKINSIPSIIQQMTGYENFADYWNFTVGLPYEDNTNSFISGPILGDVHRCVWNPDGGSGYFMGVDVGRTSHILIGKPKWSGIGSARKMKLEIHYMERFRTTKDKVLGERLLELMKFYGIRCAVIDSQPEFSTVNTVAKKYPLKTFGCEYQENRPADQKATKESKELSNIKVLQESNIVKGYRTGTLNNLMKMHNGGDIIYPKIMNDEVDQELRECADNFKNLKKVRQPMPSGEVKETYIKVNGNDHYLHALNYLNMAVEIKGAIEFSSAVAAPMDVLSFNTHGKEDDKPSQLLNSFSSFHAGTNSYR